ncbi:MAG: RNA-binding transcriptional accessory protein [Planctomycetes bacterium]|nr:RNA-binding transcriptional accessory protein [Planctomycetota bacterium]
MPSAVIVDLAPVAQATGLPVARIEKVLELLDAGNTVPFITRYRKDHTGGLDEEQIRQVQTRVGRLRALAERKQVIRRSIQAQGKLTPELDAQIEAADSQKRLEDLYLPFKPKKQTLATAAREKGLQPLANEILAADPACANLDARAADFVNTDRKVLTAADALLGAGHILAEGFSERADLRGRLREILERTGKLVCAPGEGDPQKHKAFRDYFEYREELSRVPPHRVLAINRGERAKALKVKVDADTEAMLRVVDELCVPPEHPHVEFLRGCSRDAFARLVLPSLEREIRRELTEFAEAHAVEVFARNLRNLLLQAPVRDRRVLALDPGFRSGCKAAAIDAFGNLLDHAVVHFVGSDEAKQQARAKLVELIEKHELSVVAIGNGTACRETEELIADLIANELKDKGVSYVIVNEAGASVYSTSTIGREEFPEYDATLRGAISIGRRLQDPLSELVKIDAASIGVGLYQHDVKEKHLRSSLDDVVESCVNYVGVDLNTASPALLRYVSGLNQLTARRLFDHRQQYGPFKSREQLKDVVGFGEQSFIQSAGFLKITGGENPLDATWIHPESYDVAERVLTKVGAGISELANRERASQIAEEATRLDATAVAGELHVGLMTLQDIVAQLARPGRDPRADLPPPIFRRGIIKLEDLTPGMELNGTVLNVVDFGAFVDIGLKDSGLVHISQLANRYIKSPHEVVAVGDIVKVWVLGVDKERRRVSLTMIAPGSQRRPEPRPAPAQRERPPRKPRPQHARTDQAPSATGAPAKTAAAPRPAAPPRPAGPPKRRPEKPAKPLVPLTKGMKEGKEPLRTFGDLKQFFDIKKKPPEQQEPASDAS